MEIWSKTLPERLMWENWSHCTVDEIAEQTGHSAAYVQQAICRLRKEGIEVCYIRKRPGRKRKERPIR